MQLIFLGTSSGTPTKDRNVSAVAIREKNSKSWCLVDCGEGTQHQILHTDLSLNNLRAIFITHIHGDHCYGLPGLLASAAMGGRKQKLIIVGVNKIKEFINAVIKHTDLFLPYEVEFHDVDDLDESMETGFDIETIELSHRVPSYAYAFTSNSTPKKLDIQKLIGHGITSGPICGKLQQGIDCTLDDGALLFSKDFLLEGTKPHKIIICGDNDNPELLSPQSKDVDVIVHEATYTQDIADKVGMGPQHSSARNIAKFAETNKIKNLVLTHFSARYQNNIEKTPPIQDIEDEAKNFYKGNLLLARDFDVFELNKAGLLTLCGELS